MADSQGRMFNLNYSEVKNHFGAFNLNNWNEIGLHNKLWLKMSTFVFGNKKIKFSIVLWNTVNGSTGALLSSNFYE